MRKVVIGAAAGNIGSRLARRLMHHELELVLVTKNGEVPYQINKNATVVKADMSDMDAIVSISRQADGIFWLIPPNFKEPSLKQFYYKVGTAGAEAVVSNKISHSVVISSVGAGSTDELAGTVSYTNTLEEIFIDRAENIVFLRPGYFMENFLLQVEAIKNKGAVYFPFKPDHDIPFISTDDISDISAEYLVSGNWAGQWSRNLLGPENLSIPEIASILSSSLQRQVRYERISFNDVRAQFAAMGASKEIQNEMVDLMSELTDPIGIYSTPRTREAHTPTTFHDFIQRKMLPYFKNE